MIVGKEEPSFTIVGNGKWSSHSGNEYGDSSIKLNINIPYNTIIALHVQRTSHPHIVEQTQHEIVAYLG